MRMMKPLLSTALIAGAVAAWPSAGAQAQSQMAAVGSPLTSWEINIYLLDSERARAAAALEQASRSPIGAPVSWSDTQTRAGGAFVATGETRRADGAACRTYDVVVNVPRRNSMVQRYISNGSNQNPAITYYEDPVQLSPAFSRRFTQAACRTAGGQLIPG